MRERLQVGTDTRSTRRILDSFLALLVRRQCYPVLDEVARHGEAVGGGGALLGEPHPPEVEDGDGVHAEGVGEQPRQLGHLVLHLPTLQHTTGSSVFIDSI